MAGNGQCRLEAQERLILHADVVRAFHLNFAHDRLFAANDALTTKDVAIRVNRGNRIVETLLWVDQR